MNDVATVSYRHTQKGPWALVFYAIGTLLFGLTLFLWAYTIASIILPCLGALMLLIGAIFQQLTVADDGDGLAIRFGPLPLVGTRIRFEDIHAVEVGTTTWLDSWGIHYSPRGGWVWNIWGWDCVIIHHRGKTFVGTDDAENLAQFLKAKVAGLAAQSHSQ